ncbi:hypothetical protein [Sorangium sp. So ce1182]|uniref:hypothetical protein n=1 Tax=Sorangium sp. So ce1182 TaxID=3133334 RepID=UPI003F6122D3
MFAGLIAALEGGVGREPAAFIAELFRSRQQDARRLEPPFSEAQRASLVEGRVPDGPL